ncbi:hypothetical protein [Janthinobacterium aquaticum]|uniref:hypothetical protein n=1 Tax=Janthinobacterium sp. FT58W TaxID=2654254 RepID=UPI001264F603|nr:hypothetical protein [Janthinobacterium sp. FT58W]KAB8038529.1 hypothetical protein GCM43_22180 [Janthinobacterium sp. FT58W]
MDYFQGVVTDYLRADRAMFINTECCIQLNPGHNPDRTGHHWYCDAVAVNFRTREVFLCEVSYSKSLNALLKRITGWNEHWTQLKQALVRDCAVPGDWHVQPWLFVPAELQPGLERKLALLPKTDGQGALVPTAKITALENILPWKYPSWNRIAEEN